MVPFFSKDQRPSPPVARSVTSHEATRPAFSGDGVPDSVVAARGAGIRVVMITGDYLLTAIAIAKNVTGTARSVRKWGRSDQPFGPLGLPCSTIQECATMPIRFAKVGVQLSEDWAPNIWVFCNLGKG